MKKIWFIKQGSCFLILIQSINFSYAGTPLWTFLPLTKTAISVSANSSTTVQYQITNQSSRSHTLTMSAITGASQITTGSGICSNPFRLSAHASCILNLSINGSQVTSGNTNGPIVCEQGSTLQCYRPATANTLDITILGVTTLSTSLSNLSLATNGKARTITITNTGSNIAENLLINYPTWPSGTPSTTASDDCGHSLNVAESCTITVTPGSNATSSCNTPFYIAPTPDVITVSASNVISSPAMSVVILTYGCIYEEGYVFAIDDTTSSSTSIGGTTVALTDNPSNIQWYNGNFETVGASSLTNGLDCSQNINGNTCKIIIAQSTGSYAAETCANYTIDSNGHQPCAAETCYGNWYLPAICQMGAFGEGANCSSGIENMVSNLPLLISGCSGSACISGIYWSSTEYTSSPTDYAWVEQFGSNSFQGANAKNISNAVRCSRDLTP